MLHYILEVSLCWLGFYMLYAFFLSKETFHHLNRGYLLGTLFLGLLIPLLEFPVYAPANEGLAEYYLQTVTIGIERMNEAIVVGAEETTFGSSLNVMTILFWMYFIGVLIGLLKLSYGLWQVFKIYQSGKIISRNGYQIVETQSAHLPFSFFNILFWNKNLSTQTIDNQKIIRHEEAHIHQGHSWDVIITELLSIAFWCSPLIYFYKNSIRVVHEYLADDFVLKISKKKPYSRLLLMQSQSGMSVALANHFFDSQLKKRLKMMTKTKSTKKAIAKYLFVLPLLALTVLLFANENVLTNLNFTQQNCEIDKEATSKKFLEVFNKIDSKKDGWEEMAHSNLNNLYKELQQAYPNCENEIANIGKKAAFMSKLNIDFHRDGVKLIHEKLTMDTKVGKLENGEDIYNLVSEMPRFPGCEDLENAEKQDLCVQKKMLTFIYTNIKYPATARNEGIQGMVVSQFVIDREGNIINAKITKSIGGGCDEEVLRVVNEMPKWIPGTNKGEPVNVQINLPVRFMLDNDKDEPATDSARKPADNEIKLKALEAQKPSTGKLLNAKEVDQMPLFNGTQTEEGADAKATQMASNKLLIEFIFKNLKYPKTAAKEGVEGRVVAKFTVDNEGNVKDAHIVKSLHLDCDEEVLRVLNAMPNWIPAQKDGKEVAVSMALPIQFKLDDTTKEEAANSKLPDAIQNLNIEAFKIYPNPSAGRISVDFKTQAGATLLQIIDSSGKEVFSQNFNSYSGNFESVSNIDISNAHKGTLFVVLSQDKGGKKYAERVIYQ